MFMPADLAYALPIVAAAYLVLGLAAFGSALIAVPLLAWRWPLAEVVPLILMLDVLASILLGGLNLKSVAFAEIRRMLPGLVLGTALGLWLLRVLDARWPLALLGAYVTMVGLNALRVRGAPPAPAGPGGAWPAGVAVGVVEMLFGTAGPVVLAWLNRRLADVRQLRATVPVTIVVAASSVLVGMGLDGRLSSAVLWQRMAWLLPVALACVWLGNHLARHVPAARMRQIICALLAASGLMLVWRAWRG